MARRMRSNFRRGRRFTRGRRNYQWSSVIIGPTAITADEIDEFPMLVTTDYNANSGLSPSGVTLIRTVGTIVLNLGTAPVAGAAWIFMGIGQIDSDETVSWDPSGQDLTDERWIWTGLRGLAVGNGSSGVYDAPRFELDIRQRVRLRDDAISLFVHANIASVNTITLMASFRMLLTGSTT